MFAALAAALLPATSAQAQTTVWSATLTVDVGSIYSGCSNSGGYQAGQLDDCSTATILTDDDFDYSGTTYTIQSITAGTAVSQDFLGFKLDGVTPANAKTALSSLTLHVGTSTYAISNALTNNSARGLFWTHTLAWSNGQTIALKLTAPDNTAPTVVAASTGYYSNAALSTALSGTQGTGTNIYTKVTFSEDMKQVASNAAAARPQLFYRIGTTDTQYDILAPGATLASGDCKPNHTSETDEYVCLYTVGASASGAFAVKAGTNSVDKADNALASAYTHATSLTLDTTRPTVTAASTGYYTSAALSTALAGAQKAGTNIYTKVTFSEDMKQVASDTATARPQLFYRIGTTDTQYDILAPGGTLASGDCKPNHASETDEYVCLYTVGSSASGAFAVKAGTSSVDKADNALAAAYTHAASLTLDTADPAIAFPSGVTPTTGTAATITLTDAGSKVKRYGAIAVAGTATDATGCDMASEVGTLTTLDTPASPVSFSYTPPPDSAGRKVCAYVEDAAGNSHASLWTTAIAQGKPAKPAGLAAARGDQKVVLTWTNPNDSTITRYQLAHKAKSVAGSATFADISGSGAGTVRHEVTGLMNGTAYQFWLRAVNGAGEGPHAGPVEETPTAVDNTGPTVSTVAVTSTVPSNQDGKYKIGDAIAVTVTFNEGIVVTGSPVLKLRVGTAEKDAGCARKGASGDDAKKLVCSYTVIEGDEDTDGIAVEANKLSLPSGATLRDSSDNDATRTYTALGNQSAHKVDGVRPTVTGVEGGSSGFHGPTQSTIRVLVRFSENVEVTGAPTLAIRVGAAARTATFSAFGQGSDNKPFDYNVQAGEVDTDGVGVDAGSVTLPSGASVTDYAGNAAVLTHTGAAALSAIKVDGVKPAIGFPSTGPWLGREARIALTDAHSKVRKHGAILVAGTATDATGCNTAAKIGSSLTTLATPASPATLSYTPPSDSTGKKVCAYVEDTAGNSHAALWTTAIAAPPAVPPPAAPGGLRALGSKSNDGTVALYWNGGGDRSITKYQVAYGKTGESGETWRDIRGSGAFTSMYTVRGLENRTEYAFRLRAVNDGGAGAASATRWATPGKVTVHGVTLTRFRAEPGDEGFELGWRKLSGRTYCGYIVEWRKTGTEEWSRHEFGLAGDSPGYTVAGLEAGTEYEVRVLVQSGYTDRAPGLAWETVRTTTGAAPGGDAPPVTAPALEWARVNGAELALRFDAALDEESTPAASAFSVSVAGAARAVSAVTVSGGMATLTLVSAVTSGEAVTVGYAPPSTGRLRRAGGGDVAAFSGQAVTNDTPARQVPAALTASVSGAPAEHRGKGRFALRIAFSEAVTAKAKDAGVQVTGGTLARAARVDRRRDLWELRIEPSGRGAVTVTLPATTDCSASGAVCTADGRKLATALAHTVAGPAAPAPAALTASVSGAPSEHRGKGRFELRIAFSEAVTAKAKDARIQVTGGTLARAVRVDGRRDLWELRVAPSGNGAVTVTLPATTDCAASGAVCAADGRKLATALTHTVPGPVQLSVADARAKEGEDASMDFAVTLSRAASGAVTVRYATRNGTAKAGKDYTKAKGTLTFAAGETAKTVSVAVLDDAKDEGEETFRLVLSKASGAIIADGEAVGTIENDDPMPQAWLARFGRTVAGQAVDAVTERLEGGGPSRVTLGGQSLSLDTPEGQAQAAAELDAVAAALGAGTDGADGTWSRERWMRGENREVSSHTMTGRELLLGSAFHLQSEGETGGPVFAAWGRVAHGSFDGDEDGVTMNGEVTTGFLGADVASGRWLAGAAVARSEGEGTFALSGSTPGESAFDKGEIESSLTSVLPYARLDLSDRVTAWGMLGYGTGELVLTETGGAESERHEADLTMTLGAVGGRGTLVPAPEGGGFALALRTDAFWVRTESDATEGMEGATADATRLRLILDASRPFALEGGGALTPTLEVGLRHDGGDAETGTGVELGAGLAWTDPASGVTAVLRGRWLAAHEASGYEEWGVSGSVRVDPGERGRGLSLTLAPTVGNAGSGTGNLWSAADARGLAPGGAFEAGRRLDAELGYGLALFGDRFTGTPNLGVALSDGARAYRLGWRLTSAVPGDPGFEIGLDATRTESANDNEPEHGLMLRGSVRW